MKALEVSVSSRFATILKSKSHSIHSFPTKTSISLNSLFTRMSPMIVSKVIAVFVVMAVMSSPVLSQAVDCTDADQPVSKENFDQTCKSQICDCFPNSTTCPPQWSRNFADGLAVYQQLVGKWRRNWRSLTIKCLGNHTEYKNKAHIVMDGSATNTTLMVQYWCPHARPHLYFYQDSDVNSQTLNVKSYAGEVRYPDTSEGWLNTSFMGPKINGKGLWDLSITPLNAEVVNWSKQGKHYPSSYSFTVPTDPLFDRRITESMHKQRECWIQLDKYCNWNDSINLEFQAITLENNFDLKFNPRIKLIKLRRNFYICLGSKVDAQTGRKYWTAEGCRPLKQLKIFKLKKDEELNIYVGAQHEMKCECDFDSIGFKPIPVTTTLAKETPTTVGIPTEEQSDQNTEQSDSTSGKPTARRVRSAPTNEPKLVEGFNHPEGLRKPRKLISASYATYITAIFGLIVLAICLLLIVAMIAITVYYIYYKNPQ